MTLAIRPATSDDLETLRVLLKETWHATYDAIYGPEKVDELTAGWHSIEAMEQRLRRADASFLVAERDGTVAGLAFAASEEPGAVCLHQLYVAPSEQGRGVGSALLAEVEARFASAERIRLDVEVANRPAVAFYEARGFAALGLEAETPVPRMMRMERSLAEHRTAHGQADVSAP